MVTHEIIGDDMQAVIFTLGAGDEVRAEAGAMMFMTDAIEMDAKMEGGILGGLKRKLLAGESLFRRGPAIPVSVQCRRNLGEPDTGRDGSTC
jgi:uncharacterized protein (AIM24 family)